MQNQIYFSREIDVVYDFKLKRLLIWMEIIDGCPIMGKGTMGGVGTGDLKPNFPLHGPHL